MSIHCIVLTTIWHSYPVEATTSQNGCPYVNPSLNLCCTPNTVTVTELMMSVRHVNILMTKLKQNKPCVERKHKATMVICFTRFSRNRNIKHMFATSAATIASILAAIRMDGFGRESMMWLFDVWIYLDCKTQYELHARYSYYKNSLTIVPWVPESEAKWRRGSRYR